jgi:hypothetical protein
MAVKLVYNELTAHPPILKRISIPWTPELTAAQAIATALGAHVARTMERDLIQPRSTLTVAWMHTPTGEHRGIGGVSALDWDVPDQSVLIITYQDATTTEAEEQQAIAWMLEDDEIGE